MVPHCESRFLTVFLIIVTLLNAAGCGSAPVPVHGTVTYKGKGIMKGGISFVAADGDTSDKVTVTEEIQGGEYAIDAKRGLKPGMYKVEIYGTVMDSAPSSVDPDLQSSAAANAIPDKYNKKTELSADVHAGSGPIDFELTP